MEYRTYIHLAHFAALAIVLKVLNLLLPSSLVCYYATAANLLLFLHLATLSFLLASKWYFTERVSVVGKAVFITGCDSGFGHQLAKRLDGRGFHVFAGCLFPKGVGAMELQRTCSKYLKIIALDVTKEDSVQNAVETVKKNLGSTILWAVVNNAGVFKGFSLDMSSIEDVKDTFEVNAFGPIRVSKAFLPLLRESKGRIVNVASLGGRLSSPFMMPYCMSKFAAVAFTECIRSELKVWGIRVISIEPEGFRTPMVSSNRLAELEAACQNLPSDIKDRYGEQYKKRLDTILTRYCQGSSTNIEKVVDDLESAVSLKYPSSVYKSCRNVVMEIMVYVIERLPKGLLDYLVDLILWPFIPSLK